MDAQRLNSVKETFASLLKEELSEQVTTFEQEENFRLAAAPKNRDRASRSIFKNIRSVISTNSNVESNPFESSAKTRPNFRSYKALLKNIEKEYIDNREFTYIIPAKERDFLSSDLLPVGTASEQKFVDDLTENDTLLQVIHHDNQEWNIMINYTKGSAADVWLINNNDSDLAIDLSDLLDDLSFSENEHRLDFAELKAFHNIISKGLLNRRLLIEEYKRIIEEARLSWNQRQAELPEGRIELKLAELENAEDQLAKLQPEELQRTELKLKREELKQERSIGKKFTDLMENNNPELTSKIMAKLSPLAWKTAEQNFDSIIADDNTPEGTVKGTLDGLEWTYDFTSDSLTEKEVLIDQETGYEYEVVRQTSPSKDGDGYTVMQKVDGKLANFNYTNAIEFFNSDGELINYKKGPENNKYDVGSLTMSQEQHSDFKRGVKVPSDLSDKLLREIKM